MAYNYLDRSKLKFKPLAERKNRVSIKKDFISLSQKPANTSREFKMVIEETIEKIQFARKNDRPVILAFGAHTIKNGLGPVLIKLMEREWITHLATNGAGIIHDWEFAFQGESSEDVRANVQKGQFGIWEETGFYINLAINIGAYEGKGYGESVGALIQNEGLNIPSIEQLREQIFSKIDDNPELAASAADLLTILKNFSLRPGWLSVPHSFKEYSVQAAAFRLNIPFTGHPMIGHDIIYTHPMNHGAAIGRAALKDFLSFAHSISRLNGGVYLSIGSAVMSPMIFEKSLSMAQNLAIQQGKHIDNHYMIVVDLAQSNWDWEKNGEPPVDNPAYYLRYCKTFSRMGGTMRYLSADNRDFLLALYHRLEE